MLRSYMRGSTIPTVNWINIKVVILFHNCALQPSSYPYFSKHVVIYCDLTLSKLFAKVGYNAIIIIITNIFNRVLGKIGSENIL